MKNSIFLAAGLAALLNAGMLPSNVIKSSSLAQENGGAKTAIDAYSDGAGALLINQAADTKFDNSPMNKLVFKYGEEAKKNSVNLVQQVQTVSTTSTAQEKILAGSILAVVPPSCADGAMSWNGVTKLCEKGGTSTYAGTYNNSYSCPTGGTLSGTTCLKSSSYGATFSPYDNCEGGSRTWSNASAYCASKGMRLPDLQTETTYLGRAGAPSCGGYTWTSTVGGYGYYSWSGTAEWSYAGTTNLLVRCVGNNYTCPGGGTLSGTTCTINQDYIASNSPYYTCPSGGTLSGTTCTLNTFTTSPGICQSGYTMNNLQCLKN